MAPTICGGVWLKRKNNTQDVVFGNGQGPRLHHFAFHTPKRWELSDTTRAQLWGFPVPRKWFAEASEFDGIDVKKTMMDAAPVTLEDFLANW
jgi:hypothetical protein